MRRTRSRLLLVLALLPAAPGRVLAQDPPAPPEEEPEPAWSASVGLSYLATSGNSDSESIGFDLKAKRRPDPWGLELSALANRAAQDGERTAERYFAGLRGTRTLSERWSLFAGLSAEKDEFADLDLRSLVEAGGTYKALLGPRHLLDLDFGLTWTDENRLPPEPDARSLGGLAGLTYDWKISDSASFSQRLVYYPNFDESDDWRAESLSALTAALNKRLAMRLSYEVRYRNQPIDLNDDTDTTTKVSLVWNL